MRKLIRRSIIKAELWLLRSSEVARFDGIILADFCKSRNRQFCEITLAALRLLKETDSHRYARVRKRLAWVAHQALEDHASAEYRHATRTCAIDLPEPSDGYDVEYLTGYCASTLVHEATHGEIRSRGIHYTRELRSRIEKLCVKEEQNFVTRLTFTKPDLADRLYHEFDPSGWKESWNSTPWDRFRVHMRRIFVQK